jgi:hypothetical protein
MLYKVADASDALVFVASTNADVEMHRRAARVGHGRADYSQTVIKNCARVQVWLQMSVISHAL